MFFFVKKFLFPNFFWILSRILLNNSWRACQSCLLRVHRTLLRITLFSEKKFFHHSQTLNRSLLAFCRKSPAGLSKLHFACQWKQLEEKINLLVKRTIQLSFFAIRKLSWLTVDKLLRACEDWFLRVDRNILKNFFSRKCFRISNLFRTSSRELAGFSMILRRGGQNWILPIIRRVKRNVLSHDFFPENGSLVSFGF